MITRLEQIKGVGRFKKFLPDPPIEFQKLNIIYGNNGTGKSTVAAIFRSVATGNVDELRQRVTIGANATSIVMGRDDGSKLAYSSPGATWSQTIDEVHVFDESFIIANVFRGPVVDVEHSRNLNTVVLGDTVRELNDERTRLKDSISGYGRQVKELRRKITSYIRRPEENGSPSMSLEDFGKLPYLPDVDDRLKSQETYINQLERVADVLGLSEFEEVELPEFPALALEELLNTTIANVEATAERQVRAHIAKYQGIRLESWLEQGTTYSIDLADDCPYCGQPLRGSSLIEQYQSYFNQAYKDLKLNIDSFDATHLQLNSQMDRAILSVVENRQLRQTWQTILESINAPSSNSRFTRTTFDDLISRARSELDTKSRSPLEPMDAGADFYAALNAWNRTCEDVKRYNRLNAENNEAIRKHKGELSIGDLATERSKRLELINSKVRHSPELVQLWSTLQHVEDERSKDKERLKIVTAELREQSSQIFSLYGETVNELLNDLRADFRISKFKQRMESRGTQADYHIGLLGTDIPVGRDKLAGSGQSYKTALSEGDRRTLALAFFLARIQALPALHRAIVFLDDPVTSMDDNRCLSTTDLILDICREARQVFVSSHQLRFLNILYRKYRSKPDRFGGLAMLETCNSENDIRFSEIRPGWDIKKAIEGVHEKDIKDVIRCIAGSRIHNPHDIERKLRVMLETHYRLLYPDEFNDDIHGFGGFVGTVEGCENSSPLAALRGGELRKMQALRDTLNTFHHSEPLEIGDVELRQLCRGTLDLLGRRYD